MELEKTDGSDAGVATDSFLTRDTSTLSRDLALATLRAFASNERRGDLAPFLLLRG